MDNDPKLIEERLARMEQKIDAVYQSSEKMRKYFLWTLIVTLVVVVVPLFILPFLIPSFLQTVAPVGL